MRDIYSRLRRAAAPAAPKKWFRINDILAGHLAVGNLCMGGGGMAAVLTAGIFGRAAAGEPGAWATGVAQLVVGLLVFGVGSVSAARSRRRWEEVAPPGEVEEEHVDKT